MNFLQIDRLLIPEIRKQRQAHLFATAQSQHRYLQMLNGPDATKSLASEVLEHMLKQECGEVASACRSTYLQDNHEGRVSKVQLTEAIQIIIQFGMRFDLLDQTILQANAFFEAYLAKNRNVMNCFLAEIAIIAVALAIKINEDRVLSLEECVNMVDHIGAGVGQPASQPNTDADTSCTMTDQSLLATRQGEAGTHYVTQPEASGHNTSSSLGSSKSANDRFNVHMFAALEKHMLLMLGFRINLPTALDFAMFFAHRVFPENEAQVLVQNCIPWMYFVNLNYDIGRGVLPSAVALAALCYVIQASESYHDPHFRNSLLHGLEEKTDLMRQTESLIGVFHDELELYQRINDSGIQEDLNGSVVNNLQPQMICTGKQSPIIGHSIGFVSPSQAVSNLVVTEGPWPFPASQKQHEQDRTNEEEWTHNRFSAGNQVLNLQDNRSQFFLIEDTNVMESDVRISYGDDYNDSLGQEEMQRKDDVAHERHGQIFLPSPLATPSHHQYRQQLQLQQQQHSFAQPECVTGIISPTSNHYDSTAVNTTENMYVHHSTIFQPSPRTPERFSQQFQPQQPTSQAAAAEGVTTSVMETDEAAALSNRPPSLDFFINNDQQMMDYQQPFPP